MPSDDPTSEPSNHHDDSHEDTPLLARSDDAPRYDGTEDDATPSPAATSLHALQSQDRGSSKGGRRWPAVVAVLGLGLALITVIIGAFFAPAAIEEYAMESLVIEPTNLSIHNFTSTGVTARVQANFRMDALKVKNEGVRNVGRFVTWIAGEVETTESKVEIYLPEYGGILIGTAAVPRLVVGIRNGHTTAIDFLSDLEPGDLDGIRRVANDWLEGRLNNIRVLGKANVGLKSGLIPLGSQTIAHSLVFEGNNLPSVPEYNITRLNFHEVPISSNGRRGVAANASLSLGNNYPIELSIPPMNFDILVPNCRYDQEYIRIADAMTDVIYVEPYSDVNVDVGAIARDLPKTLLETCPNSDSSSPLDLLLGKYVHGEDITMFVRGSTTSSPDTWISALIANVTVPVPFPGKTFDNLIRNFSLTDTTFSLPNPMAEPGSDEANPHISGTIEGIARLPEEMNFAINVTKVRANATVSYKGSQLGILNLRKWQPAESERIEPKDGEDAGLKIQSRIKDAPLNITDDDVFTDVLQALLFGQVVQLEIVARVDVEAETVLGTFLIKNLPAEGVVPVRR